MPQALFYDANGAPIAEERLGEAIARGEAFTRSDARVSIEKDGQIADVSAEEAANFMRNGWGVATSDSVAQEDARIQAQRSPVLAATEGLAEGLSLGLSRKAGEALLGEEYARNAQLRAQENPVLSAAGEAAGIIAPALLTGGTAAGGRGLAATALRATPSGLMARGAMAGGELLAGRAALSGVKQAGTKAIELGAAGAIEGAGTQLVQNVAEFDDEAITMEKLFAGVPQNALLGLALGGVLGGALGKRADVLDARKSTAGHVAPEVARIADASTVNLQNAAPDAPWSPLPDWASSALAKASAKVTGVSEDSLKRVLSDADVGARWQQREAILPKLREQIAPDLDEVNKLRDVTKALEALPSNADDVRRLVRSDRLPEIGVQTSKLIEDTAAAVTPDLPAPVSKFLESSQERLKKSLEIGDAASTRAELENLRRDTLIEIKKNVPRANQKSDKVKEASQFRAAAEAQLTRLDEALGNQAIWGDAATAYVNRADRIATVTDSGKAFRTELRDPAQFLKSVRLGDGKVEQALAHLDHEKRVADDLLASGRGTAEQRAQLQSSRDAAERLSSTLGLQARKQAEVNVLDDILQKENLAGETSGLVSGLAGFAAGGLPGAVGGALARSAWGAISRPGSLARKIGAAKLLRDRVTKVDNKITRAVRRHMADAVERSPNDLVPEAPVRRLGSRGLATRASIQAFGATAKERRETYVQKIERIKQLGNDPLLQQRYVSEVLVRGVGETHPGLVVQAAAQHARAVSFIQSKLPPTPTVNPLQPQLTKPYVSDAEVDRMSKYMTAIERPMSVLEDWERGVVSAESVEALKVVYPGLYGALAKEVQTQLLKTTKPLPYNEQLQASILLGLPGNYFQSVEFQQRQSARYARVKQQEQENAQERKPMSATAQRQKAEASMTQSEKLETRL